MRDESAAWEVVWTDAEVDLACGHKHHHRLYPADARRFYPLAADAWRCLVCRQETTVTGIQVTEVRERTRQVAREREG